MYEILKITFYTFMAALKIKLAYIPVSLSLYNKLSSNLH